jgi:hypothetical protein
LSVLALSLGAAGLLAGATGAWSPCGFSMVDTLASGMGDGRRRTTLVSCATFAVGAVLGGVATYGGLAALGALLHSAGDGPALAVAAVLAAAAAVGEALGVRIVPQIRRQVPEPWRRTMPLALASWLYGILLGLGFTTFVLTLAVWALAGVSLAAGDVTLGLVIGVGFGVGRALPVVGLASSATIGTGRRLLERMEQRPHLLRRLRVADAAALALCAVLLTDATARAAITVAAPATDPTVAGDDLAWQQPGAGWVFRRGAGPPTANPGSDPALGGNVLAVRQGDTVTVAKRDTGTLIARLFLPGVDKLAVSDRWLVYRRRRAGGDELYARPLAALASGRRIARMSHDGQLSRPSLAGDTVVFGAASTRGSEIVALNLRRRRRRTVRSSSTSQLLNPSTRAGRLLYVKVSRCRQSLRLTRISGRRERVLLSLPSTARRDAGHEPGHTGQGSEPTRCPGGSRGPGGAVLWSTALTSSVAYVTILRLAADGSVTPSLLSVRR